MTTSAYPTRRISAIRTESLDRGYKKALYARHGVKEYWIVSPQTKNIEVYGISSGGLIPLGEYKVGERLLSPLLPGFTPALDEVFDAH